MGASNVANGPSLPVNHLIGDHNECWMQVDGVSALSLLDTGSMVTTVSQDFLRTHFPSLPVNPVSDLLVVRGPLDEPLPYTGFVELEMSLPWSDGFYTVGVFPVLVSPNTGYNAQVPILVGTNVLNSQMLVFE